MNFVQLVRYIKSNGCKVIVYNREELKQSQCSGTFDITKRGTPLICLATKGHADKQLAQLLLHEYAHFLQWKDGFLHKLEGKDFKEGWNILDLWLSHNKKFTDIQLKNARDAVILIEYDADIRVLALSKELNIDIGNHNDHMADAYSYITLIKWAIKNKRWGQHPGGDYFDGRIRSPKEILSEITQKEEKILDLQEN